MSFIIDKQTLDDLGIFGKRGDDSVYSIYNHTHTKGGAEKLEHMFRYPLSDLASIQDRSGIIRYFRELGEKLNFPFRGALFDEVEAYLANNDTRSRLLPEDNTLERKFKNYLASDNPYQTLQKGVLSVIAVLVELQDYIVLIRATASQTPYCSELEDIEKQMQAEGFSAVLAMKGNKTLNYEQTATLDGILRFSLRDTVYKLLHSIYTLDVYISVAQVSIKHNFVFPKALPGENNLIKLEDVYHPKLSHPVPNSITITAKSHIVFLTGANMAGKSTFMKSLGIALFVAHVGFPVAAKSMKFSVKDGMYTTINLPDNLSMGYSHFYAEVLRVKKIAEEIGLQKNLFVMFDEMFRGTNVKDAYDATVALTEAFDQKPNCTFIISTHITEAGERLKASCRNISFRFLPTSMDGPVPVYSYQLASGISEDRHGMIIINNERILEIIRSGKVKEVTT
jgi:DNA mismatch repair protein MutS